jgi:hypothetical protein
VKYIPQNYLEEICNEIGSGKGSRFYDELQQVIFSHVPEAKRLGFGTLDDLLAHRSEETNQAIEQFNRELQLCNATIVTTEDRLSPQYRLLSPRILREGQLRTSLTSIRSTRSARYLLSLRAHAG